MIEVLQEVPSEEVFNTGRTFNTVTDGHDEWLTPPYIVEALGEFDLDPCSPANPPWRTATTQYSLPVDGLEANWEGRVWCNPPYGRETFKWLAKLADHGNGTALIFARTETKGFHSEIWEKAHSVFFFKGRLKFFKVTGEEGGTANAPSCLVSYSKNDTIQIYKASKRGDLVGSLVLLNTKG